MVIWESAVNYNTIQFTALKPKPGQKTGGKPFAEQICSFDIEVTRFEEIEQSVMFVWQFSIDNKIVIIGRTWSEFIHMLHQLKEQLSGLRLLVYCHNLSFEFQYLAGIYDFSNREVFATDSRKILKCSMYNCFEFRCSYKLFNMSLEAVTKKFNCLYTKRSGQEFDYTKKRTSKTSLTREELLYCVYDVMGVVESVKAALKLHGDNLYTIPFTQTGYVRREAKKNQRGVTFEVRDCFPDLELYKVLKAAFRGGNTHANRFFAGEVLNKVHGNDVSSEYPAQQVLEQYPRTPFREIGAASLTPRYIDKMIERGYAILMIVDFHDIELRTWYNGFPYLPTAKAIGKPLNVQADNGRILKAGYYRTALTDLDYKIAISQYQAGRIEIVKAWISNYGPMYDGIIELNKELFTAKTELKGIKGQELYYNKAKEQLNAIYGMSCQSPLTTEILFSHFLYKKKDCIEEEVLEAARKRAFLPYQMGVWTTAHARTELQKFIDRAGEMAVYCDTDSLMFLGDVNFSDFNEDYKRRCLDSGPGAYAIDKNGIIHFMGVFESEDVKGAGCKFERFITLGAKRYAFEKPVFPEIGPPKLELGITVSGVAKKAGADELKRKGGLEAFKPGFVWENSGKLEAIYNDEPFKELYSYEGEDLELTPNVTLRPTSYTIKLTDDYTDLIDMCTPEELEKGLIDYLEMKELDKKLHKT